MSTIAVPALTGFLASHFGLDSRDFRVNEAGEVDARDTDLDLRGVLPGGELPGKIDCCRTFRVHGMTGFRNFPRRSEGIWIHDSPRLRNLLGMAQEVERCGLLALTRLEIESLDGLPASDGAELVISDCRRLSDISAIPVRHGPRRITFLGDLHPGFPLLRVAFDARFDMRAIHDRELAELLKGVKKTDCPTTRQGLELIDQLLSNGYGDMVR